MCSNFQDYLNFELHYLVELNFYFKKIIFQILQAIMFILIKISNYLKA